MLLIIFSTAVFQRDYVVNYTDPARPVGLGGEWLASSERNGGTDTPAFLDLLARMMQQAEFNTFMTLHVAKILDRLFLTMNLVAARLNYTNRHLICFTLLYIIKKYSEDVDELMGDWNIQFGSPYDMFVATPRGEIVPYHLQIGMAIPDGIVIPAMEYMEKILLEMIDYRLYVTPCELLRLLGDRVVCPEELKSPEERRIV